MTLMEIRPKDRRKLIEQSFKTTRDSKSAQFSKQQLQRFRGGVAVSLYSLHLERQSQQIVRWRVPEPTTKKKLRFHHNQTSGQTYDNVGRPEKLALLATRRLL